MSNKPSLSSYQGHRQRLKERFVSHGDSLAEYEILELLLFYAIPRKDVKPLAKNLLKEYGSLANLVKLPVVKLAKFKGLNLNSAILIKLVLKSSEVILERKLQNKSIVKSWDLLLDYCFLQLSNLNHERVYAIYLNSKNYIIKDEVLTEGSLNEVSINLRAIIHKCLDIGAASIVIAHNHPSGVAKPSTEDILITKNLLKIAKTLNIYIYDHLIIGEEIYSFRENGLL